MIPALGCREKASWGHSLLWVYLPIPSPQKGGSTLEAVIGRLAHNKSSRRAWSVVRALGLRGQRECLQLPPPMLSLCLHGRDSTEFSSSLATLSSYPLLFSPLLMWILSLVYTSPCSMLSLGGLMDAARDSSSLHRRPPCHWPDSQTTPGCLSLKAQKRSKQHSTCFVSLTSCIFIMFLLIKWHAICRKKIRKQNN